MFKKLISILTAFALIIAFCPAVMVDATPATPTIESILDEYHEKALAAQGAGDSAAVAYSRRSGDAQLTLEQETVNKLTAAGYEAYNVTGDNYDVVEETLDTDLTSLGITDNGSHIVVVNGDSANGYQPGFPYFGYTYEGVTYALRYVTVQADDSNLKLKSDIDLLEESGDPITTVSLYSLAAIGVGVGAVTSGVGAIVGDALISLLSDLIDFGDTINTSSDDQLIYTARTNWTVVYTQVFNYDTGKWSTCASVERVKMSYVLTYHFFNPEIDHWDFITETNFLGTFYSTYYYDTDWQKEYAVLSYNTIMNYCHQDTIDYVDYELDGEDICRHWRGVENFGTIPGLNS